MHPSYTVFPSGEAWRAATSVLCSHIRFLYVVLAFHFYRISLEYFVTFIALSLPFSILPAEVQYTLLYMYRTQEPGTGSESKQEVGSFLAHFD